MILIAQTRIRLSKNGERILIEKGKQFDVNESEASRLLKIGAAEKIDTDEECFVEQNPDSEDRLPDEITEDYLEKLTKEKICQVAESLGLKLDEKMRKEDLINNVLDSIAEKQAFGGDDE